MKHHVFLSFVAVLLIGLILDLGLVTLTYYKLPDTRALASGVTIERHLSRGKSIKFRAGPSSPGYLSLRKIPKHLWMSVIILEDHRFFDHHGFDLNEIFQAVEEFFNGRKRIRGASTLSQQLVKNLYLTPERSIKRKVIEALITIKLEATLPKRQILELYLNSIDWGKGLFGISQAARHYFNKSAKNLNLQESVFLAAIVPNPSRFGEIFGHELPKPFVRTQMLKVLETLYRTKEISLEEFQQAIPSTN